MSLIPSTAETASLCAEIEVMRKEISDRIMLYIEELGYQIYRKDPVQLSFSYIKRSDKYIIRVDASFTANFVKEALSFDIPSTLLDTVIK